MNVKRLACTLLACIMVSCCTTTSVGASQVSSEEIIWIEDLEWDLIDPSTILYSIEDILPLTTESVSTTISPLSTKAVSHISLKSGDALAFNCSYSPSSADVDAGVIAPDGKFYNIKGEEGSINKTIKVSQTGSYWVAIRNNSSQTVRVVGFVDY